MPDNEDDKLTIEEAQLIESMRIYDVLMALLTLQDAGMANKINEKHSNGKFIGPMPWVSDTNQQPTD